MSAVVCTVNDGIKAMLVLSDLLCLRDRGSRSALERPEDS